MARLVSLLKKAHAGELAAYHAYRGHWESVSNPEERLTIQKIQKDELEHADVIFKMLKYLGSKPNVILDFVFTLIGRTLSFLCKWTGWLAPMYVAELIEKIGVNNYQEMLEVSLTQGHPELAFTFAQLASREEEHRLYFSKKLERDPKQKALSGLRN